MPAISGLAFEDFNANGVFDTTATIANNGGGTVGVAVDRGLSGITVTAFDQTGAGVATTTTAANGTFTLTGTVSGQPYRIQFTNLPTGFFPGPNGTDNGTTVQFVNDGATNVRLGLVKPEDYSQNNPLIASQIYALGASNGANANQAVLVSFPYGAGTVSSSGTLANYRNPTTHALAVTHSQVGATWGLGFDAFGQQLYAAAYMKKYTGFGPSGTGAIYRMGTTGTTANLFADLNAIFGANTAGANFHDFADDDDNGNVTWNIVGKNSLGGLDVSADGTRVYVMNLADRTLYALPTTGTLNSTTVYRQQLPTPIAAMGVTGTSGADPLGDLRPFAVQVYNGKIYVGAVNSAESTRTGATPNGDRNALRAYVYEVTDTGSGLTFNTTPVLQLNLNYTRGVVDPGVSANWLPWIPTRTTIGGGNLIFPQPMLTSLAFDATGNMTLGLRDRAGDQSAADGVAGRGITGGDILRAAGSPTAGWTLENNGTAGGVTTSGAGNNEGPGGGEFYYQDTYDFTSSTHDETGVGGLLQLAGFPHLLSTTFDPAFGVAAGGGFNAGGVNWFNNTTGRNDKGYQLYQNESFTFSKADGVGDLTAFRTPAPLEIGNRVWLDADADGIQDANENGIGNVAVRLYDASNNQVGSTTTDSNGNYYFNAANVTNADATVGIKPGVSYSVRLDTAANYAAGGPLFRLALTSFQAGADRSIDSNGVQQSATDIRVTVTTGVAGQSDHTFDIGFVSTLSLGNRVFSDDNNNGQRDAGEAGINGVAVQLFNSDGSGNPVGGAIASTTTANGGYYLFPGLSAGNYVVQITPPTGFVSSTGTNGSATGPFEPAQNPNLNANDNRDKGTTAGAVISSGLVTLSFAGEPTGETDIENPNPDATTPDANSNLVVDFGLFRPLSLGNFVFGDTNNNGVLDGAETGIANVLVRLLDSAGNPLLDQNNAAITATTDSNGNYLFTNLIAGTYRVEVAASNFNAGGPLAGLVSSTGTNGGVTGPFEPVSGNSTINNQDHGTRQGSGAVQANNVTLAAPGNAANPDTGTGGANTANLRQDFGFFRPLSLGNFVFGDTNNNGILDGAETGIANVLVRLLDSAGNPLLDQTNAAITATTDSNGNYLFTNLIAGTYRVEVAASNFNAGGALAGFVSSTGTNGSVTGPFEPVTGNSTTNNQDHGTRQGSGAVQANNVTLAAPGNAANPDTGTGGANTANLRQDFGFFRPLSLGNFVFGDTNNNGILDGAETGIANVLVRLLDSNGNPVLDQNNAAITATTDANGNYLFTSLIAGTYRVEIAASNFNAGGALAGLVSSTGTNGGVTGPFEPVTGNNTTNNQDHGTTQGTGAVQTNNVTLAAPGNAANPDTGASGANTANLRQDFGFFRPLSLGNFVFGDTNNNGILDGAETGIANVLVRLLDSNGIPVLDQNNAAITATTDSNGNYLFTNLQAGTYRVEVAASNFNAGGALAGFVSSTGTNGGVTGPFEPVSGNSTTNNQDHGTTQGSGAVQANNVTLAAPGNAANPDTGTGGANTANLRQDFGFFRPLSLGNFVFGDTNNNAILDGAETGIANVLVRLLDSNGNPVLDQNNNPITATTDSNGNYLYTNLQQGTYRVEVAASNFNAGGPLAGSVSSSGTNGSVTGPFEPVTGNNTTNNQDHGTRQGSGEVQTNNVTLAAPGNAANPDTGTGGANSANLRQDFGFFTPLSLGNLVFGDTNNNGILDGAETGIANVLVRLLDSTGNPILDQNNAPITATTDTNGNYLFSNLGTGTYRVEVAASNFNAGGALEGLVSSSGTNGSVTGPFEPVVGNNTTNNQDHGTRQGTGAVQTNNVTLAAPGNAANPDTGAGGANTANLRQDFGFFRPLSLGNFVFGDTNNNGSLDGAETGIANVLVRLLDSAGNPLLDQNNAAITATTDANGNYLFTNLGAGTYRVEVAASNFNAGGSLAGFVSSTGTNGSVTGPFEPVVGNNTTNNQDHGTRQGSGAVQTNNVTLAAPGNAANPDTGAGGANTANLRQDFGFFRPLSLGNFVFGDTNNNGILDGAETGIANVLVRLLDSNGNPILDQNNTPITATTDSTGNYLFASLQPGTYRVEVAASNFNVGGPLAGSVSSSGTNGSVTGPFEPVTGNNTTNNQDHGTRQGSGAIQTNNVTLAAPGNAANPDTGTGGANSANLRQDFGFFTPLSLGNLVFGDTNNNGIVDGAETGIANVLVRLLDSNGNPVLDQNNAPITATTDANGNYLFTNLGSGTYRVEVAASNFNTGGALEGLVSSTGTNGSVTGPFEPVVGNNTTNNQDHGTEQGSGAVQTNNVTLAAPGNAANPDTGAAGPNTANLRQDFGFFRPLSLGNFVFGDTNNNGVLDGAETGIANVLVRLLDSAGNPILDQNNAAITATTDANGNYLFTNLGAGTYRVEVAAANFNAGGALAGFVSSTGTNGGVTGPFEPVTGNNTTNNQDHGTRQGSGAVQTNNVTLAAPGNAANPDSSAAGANTANLRQDFGFFRPLSLGDRVFGDINNNGVVDGAETGIANVVLRLRDSNGNPVLDQNNNPLTATTDANGNYLFTNLLPGTYQVEVATANFNAGAALAGFVSSTGSNGSATGPFEPPSGNSATNNEDHGTRLGDGAVLAANVTLATPGNAANPDTGAGGTNSANLRQDFGFYRPLSLGDRVFGDTNNNGTLDGAETGIANVVLRLLDGNGTPILDANNNPITATTDSNGNYAFTNLAPGTYRVEVVAANFNAGGPLFGAVSSSGTNGSVTGPFEPVVGNNTTNNQDHGTRQGTGAVQTNNVTLGAPGNAANPDGSAAGANTANLRQDFGFFTPLSIGDAVWLDLNNNGQLDNNELGLANVAVQLLDANGNQVTSTTTNAQGGYLFTNLVPGQYRVQIAASNFNTGGALVGLVSSSGANGSASGPFEAAPNNNLDGQDKGTTTSGAVRGGLVNLQAGNQPTGEAAPLGGLVDPALDANSNRTQDFGFYRPLTLGDLVFMDPNNNGVLDSGEVGRAGIAVALRDGNGNPILDATNNPITTTTDANGTYRFTNLLPGTYRVQITLPANFISSTGGTGNPYEPGLPGTDFTNNADHGTQSGGVVTTGPVTLGVAGDTTANPDNNGTANLRQDFGIMPIVAIGSTVWRDLDNNGLLNASDPRLAGVTVRLYDSNKRLIATAVTDAQGRYLFSSDPNQTSNGAFVYGLPLTPNTRYTIKLNNPADYRTGGPLAGLRPTRSFVGNDPNLSSKGVVNGAGTFVKANANTGAIGTNNLIFNFGFVVGVLSKRNLIQ